MLRPLVDIFRAFVEEHDLFDRDDHLLLACSGGMDSTVLAHLLAAEGYRLTLAHMNFQLRGAESDGDAAFVEELARTLGAGFVTKAVDVGAEAERGESTQMVARRLRYTWFRRLRWEDYSLMDSKLVTAHHADDNVETVIINLLRGTGLRGLAGMHPGAANRLAYRPLLAATRTDLRRYARQHAISWREDRSNTDPKYLRNRVRKELLPLLKEEYGLSVPQLLRSIERVSHDRTMVEVGQSHLANTYRTVGSSNFSVTTSSGWSPEDLPAYPAFMQREIMAAGFTEEQVRQLLSATRPLRLRGEKYDAFVREDRLDFVLIEPLTTPTRLPLRYLANLPKSVGETSLYGLHFAVEPRPAALDGAPGKLYLAPHPLPLLLRPRQKGDRIQPLGMNGQSKKLKDYFIDEKVPAEDRDRIYVLANQEGTILAIPGLCVTEAGKVRPEDNYVLSVTAVRNT